MARTTGRSGFKMKSSPTKGNLGDFFSSLGKQLKSNKPSMSSSTSGASGQRAYQKAQILRPKHLKESKFEYDVRMRKEAKDTEARRLGHENRAAQKASWKADAEYYGSAEDKAKNIEPTVVEEPNVVKKNDETKKTTTKSSKSYKEAYKTRGKTYKDMTESEYIAEAKRQNKVFKETGKWDVKKSYKKKKVEKKTDKDKKGKFRVQLMVGEHSLHPAELEKLSKMDDVQKTAQGTDMYTYHTSDFETQEEANIHLEQAKQAGFENAFIPSPTKKKGFKMPGYGKRK